MKDETFTFKRQLLIIILLIIPGIQLFSQELNELMIDISQTGSLSTLLTDEQKANTEKLVITTSNEAVLNADDFTALSAMPKLKELDLSGDLNTQVLTANAFADNTTLETIKFPAKMRDIQAGAFNNSALKGIVLFPKTLTSQGALVSRFGNCQGIIGFEFPENTSFSSHEGVAYAQNGRYLVKYPCGKEDADYTIPEGVTIIGEQAFFYNHKLEELTLPASFTGFANIGATFRESTTLKKIDVVAENETFASIEGLLLNTTTKEFVYFPPANAAESLVIDGSLVESVPAGFFSYATHLKRVVFTEGFKSLGYRAFRQATANIKVPIEYIELPTTIETIDGEAFNGLNSTIQQFVCKAITPPQLTGNATFRDSNAPKVKFAVPASAHETYLTSQFEDDYYSSWASGGQTGITGNGASFDSVQIVPYREITVINGASLQGYSASGFSIKVIAEDAPQGKSFARWESTDGVTFVDPLATTTFFTMPNNDVVITAVFEDYRPYTIIGATISTSGNAAVGGNVELETDATKTVDGNFLYFKEWKVIKGDGLVIANPQATSTTFKMIDGEVEIEAVYAMAYMIDIIGGDAPLEAFEGETVSITANTRPGDEFTKWSTTTEGVVFADETSANTTFVMPASDVVIVANFRGVGIDDVEAVVFGVYPNPATEYMQLRGIDNGVYSIYNVQGNMVSQGEFVGEAISVSELTEGLYVLKINGISVRFIKK